MRPDWGDSDPSIKESKEETEVHGDFQVSGLGHCWEEACVSYEIDCGRRKEGVPRVTQVEMVSSSRVEDGGITPSRGIKETLSHWKPHSENSAYDPCNYVKISLTTGISTRFPLVFLTLFTLYSHKPPFGVDSAVACWMYVLTSDQLQQDPSMPQGLGNPGG